MERNKQGGVVLWALVAAAMLSQNLVIPVMCSSGVEDQKNYFYSPPDSHSGSPSGGSYGTPAHGGSYGTPPYHGGGSSSHGGSPPSNCGGNPPSGGHHHQHHHTSTPTPSIPTPTLTPPSGGGGGHTYNPPSGGGGGYTYTPPSGGGGGYTYTPPTGGGGGYTYTPPISGGGTPSTPVVTLTPPTTPIVTPGSPIVIPGTPIPGGSVPSPPYVFDPNSPPFSCNYWRTHPTLIWGLFGWFGTVGGAFGLSSIHSLPGLGSTTSLQQALANVRTDGYGALYREGTAALLNSMVDHNFPFSSSQVTDKFVSATHSNKAAASQAHVFQLANEGRLKN